MFPWRGYVKEILYRIRERVRLRGIMDRTPTFVYQMGKVGSSTVAQTLGHLPASDPVVHVHQLNPGKVQKSIEALRRNPGYLHEHVVTSSVLVNKQLDWGDFPCKIITLTREPVGRAVSFAFQDWRRQLPEVTDIHNLGADRMIELVMKKLQPDAFHADPGQWFERELGSVFGVDVFSVPYDFERGYVLLQNGPVDVLVIRMEDLNRSLESGLASLLDLESHQIQIRHLNIGGNKKYADLLGKVKKRLHLPSEMGDRIWSTDYAQHFYGPEIVRLREKWEMST